MKRSSDAWLAFYDAHQRPLWLYALALTGSEHDAADLVHDVLVSMLRARPRAENALAYVLRAMRNRVIDARRRAGRHEQALARGAPKDESAGPREDAAAWLERLGPEEAEIVVLRLRAGLEFDAIGRVVNRPRGTVSSTYSRAIEKLRRIAQEGEDGP